MQDVPRYEFSHRQFELSITIKIAQITLVEWDGNLRLFAVRDFPHFASMYSIPKYPSDSDFLILAEMEMKYRLLVLYSQSMEYKI